VWHRYYKLPRYRFFRRSSSWQNYTLSENINIRNKRIRSVHAYNTQSSVVKGTECLLYKFITQYNIHDNKIYTSYYKSKNLLYTRNIANSLSRMYPDYSHSARNSLFEEGHLFPNFLSYDSLIILVTEFYILINEKYSSVFLDKQFNYRDEHN